MNTMQASLSPRFRSALVLLGLLLAVAQVPSFAAKPPQAGEDPAHVDKAAQTVNLVLHLASTKPVSSVTLLDMNGVPVYEGPPEGDAIRVDGLQPGLYVAWLKIGNRVLTRRVRVG